MRLFDVEGEEPAALERADAIAVGGGDPFRLVRVLQSGAAHLIRRLVPEGRPYVGMSAGAIVAARDILPITLTSPFPALPDLDPAGAALTDALVLPHHDRPGRAALHVDAAKRYGRSHDLVPLADDEVAVVGDDGRYSIAVPGGVVIREVRADDAAGIATVFTAAARSAWSPFLGAERMERFASPPAQWRRRLASLPAGATFLVAADAAGVCAFALAVSASDREPLATGELELFYAHPRVWGSGVARRLHDRVIFGLVAAGCTEAMLWTEERNSRAQSFYRRSGWRRVGGAREREYLGVAIREPRLRLQLADALGAPRS